MSQQQPVLFSCSSDRPASWATNRILTVPSSFFFVVGEENNNNNNNNTTTTANIIIEGWSRALCCVYTWVEKEEQKQQQEEGNTAAAAASAVSNNNAAVPYLITYAGDIRPYPEAADFVSAASLAFDDICSMSMGSFDCSSNRECVYNALKGIDDIPPAVSMLGETMRTTSNVDSTSSGVINIVLVSTLILYLCKIL